MKIIRPVMGLVIATAVSVGFVNANELTVGIASAPTSIDPQFHNFWPNNSMASHAFEALVQQDEKQNLIPGLAVAWHAVDKTTWEFRLRKGVRFHDGSPFTADDVIFTFQRAPAVDNSPSGFAAFTRGKTLMKVDDHTIRIKTERPHPLMAHDASAILIISDRIGRDVATADFNSGKAAIGTGPFKYVEYISGERIVFERNEAYWGNKPEWTKVTFKTISSGATRVSSLIDGSVDIVDQIPTMDITRLKRESRLTLSQRVSHRVIYLHMDQDRDDSPYVKSNDGSTIKNPLKDVRVRRAISKAIDRDAIVDRIMDGVAVKAGQFLPEGFFGVNPNLQPEAYDPDGAKKLLAEAGHPDGFRIKLHGPNDRYFNDARIAGAIGEMLTRIGIKTEVVTMPRSEYFRRASRGGPGGTPEFSFMLAGWGAGTGEVSSPLKSLIHTYDRERGFGVSNRGRHSDAEIDKLIEDALVTVDDVKRQDLLTKATELSLRRNQAIIPLHYQVNTWAARNGIRYRARTDERTRAVEVYSE